MKNKPLQTLKYILFDAISAATAWVLFFDYRSVQIDGKSIIISDTLTTGVVIVTLAWIVLYVFLDSIKTSIANQD